jgi:hypothetical protein
MVLVDTERDSAAVSTDTKSALVSNVDIMTFI